MVFKVKIKAEIRPTEDENKVKNAIKNLFALREDEFKIEKGENENYVLFAETTRVESLEPIYNKIRQFRILETFRTQLKRNTTAGIILLQFNREAAAVNHISFYSIDSDLFDPIEVTIICSCPEEFIDWFAPHTKDGKPIKEYGFEYIINKIQEK